MGKGDRSAGASPIFDVRDRELSAQVDDLVAALQPYSHLDLVREVIVTAVKLAEEDCDRGDLKVLRTAVKELRYAFKVFSRYRDIPKISIFGSARSGPEDPEFQVASDFARRMAQSGYMVITGAGGGIMAAGNEGAGAERSFGLNISLPFEQGANQTIAANEKLINFRYFFTRKLFFVKESHGLVLMPGGFGTQDEGFETLTLIQTGRSNPAPVVMLDRPGGTYWKKWYRFVQGEMLERGCLSEEDLDLFFITDDVEQACQEIRKFYRVYHSSRYVERGEKLVLRLRQLISESHLAALQAEFSDIVKEGTLQLSGLFEEEEDEPHIRDLPRLSFSFNRRSFGRLRRLIDQVNQAGRPD